MKQQQKRPLPMRQSVFPSGLHCTPRTKNPAAVVAATRVIADDVNESGEKIKRDCGGNSQALCIVSKIKAL